MEHTDEDILQPAQQKTSVAMLGQLSNSGVQNSSSVQSIFLKCDFI